MYKQGEIVLVPFSYSDLSASKRRPALVVSNDVYNSRFPDTVICVITSNLYKDSFSVELHNNDLETGILPESSVVKCHKLFTIEQSRIVKKFSKVNGAKLSEVAGVLQNLFQK